MRPPGIKTFSRIAAFSAAAVAVLATAVHLRHEPSSPRDRAAAVTGMPHDALARELDRCRGIGMAAKDDPACEAAWGETRRRFFAPLADHRSDAGPKPEAR